MIKSIRPFLPAVIWGACIFAITGTPGEHIPESPIWTLPHIDKAIHLVMFFVLGALITHGFIKRNNGNLTQKDAGFSLMTGILWGGATELFQHCFLPTRHGNFPDFAANSFGTIFGVLFIVILWHQAKRT